MSKHTAEYQLAGTRIIHVTESAIGGVDLVLNLMHSVAQEHGVEDHFILPHDSELRISNQSTARYFQLSRSQRLLNLIPLLALTLSATFRLRPQVIWLHSTFAGLLRVFIFPLRLVGVRVVYCPHGWGMDRPRGSKLIGFAERILSWFGSSVHCISVHEMTLGRSIGIPSRKLFLLINALPGLLPEREPRVAGTDTLRALFVGRLDYQKGVDRLLSAYERVKRSDLKLTLIGNFIQDDNPELANRISRLQDQGRLTWLGWQPRQTILEQMAISDCVLVPSRWEGFGLVAVESLACGTPVVAAPVGGLSEIVTPEVGWLVDAEIGLQSLLENLTIQDCMMKSSACRQRFQAQYSQAAYSQRYTKALTAALSWTESSA